MGLLDDAIREHLDLKRRRGADPAEVQRAEQEALGPVRRGPIEAEPPPLVLDAEHQPQWDEEFTDEHELPTAADAGAPASYAEPDAPLEPRAAVAPELFHDKVDPFRDEGPSEPEPQPSFGEPAPPPHRASLPRDRLGETVEYDVQGTLGEGGGRTEEHARPPGHNPPEGADEDPLEETPEFLQETPDHDRLWFEQRPPRDFDFDG